MAGSQVAQQSLSSVSSEPRPVNDPKSEMICFEIFINGNKACTASVDDSGVLTAIVTWVNSRHTESGERLFLHVGGSNHADVHLDWLNGLVDLQPGDEVTIKIIESYIADEATQTIQPAVGEPDWWKKYRKQV
ncbi:MAG TPA: hypothetical protein VFD58_16120 [Blastocatellia bacterium]|nr:hypothetical protein [Blastocatellia bacterium]